MIHEQQVNLQSRILAKLELDHSKIKQELELIARLGFDDSYQEYAFGTWRTKTLWNQAGADNGMLSKEYVGQSQKNYAGKQTQYLSELVERNFALGDLKSVRIFNSHNGGMILPHIDYLEFKKGFHRIHLVLKSDDTCLNSENDTIYNMQPGELWFLDGREMHSALSASWEGKSCLVLDFSADIPLGDIFKPENGFSFSDLNPKIIRNRSIWSEETKKSFIQLAESANRHTVKGLLGLACSFHFYHRLSCFDMFKLTDEAFSNHKCNDVKNYYANLRAMLIEKGYQPSITKKLSA